MEDQAVYVRNNQHPEGIITHSGLIVDVFNPKPDMFCIEDIAHALSNICRFGGHTPVFYSVAEHSIRVSHLVAPVNKFQALMHDAAEAYLFDMPSPIKKHLVGYEGLENGIMLQIAKKFNFSWPMADEVHQFDKEILKIEWNTFFQYKNEKKIFQCFNSEDAKSAFLYHFKKYSNL